MSNQNTLIVYYREGCHLCEQMVAFLSQEQLKHQASIQFEINIIDIDDDPELAQKYNVDVPVAMYQDEVIFYHFFDAEEFERTLKKMKSEQH
ncbi:MAG: glutaredoxin family protein [Cocleimonas sp.]|nr:glutaredoxin family protein [Cocleimonas sp.]